MKVAKTINSVRKAVAVARRAGRRIGFVPTMGALHEGHISLIDRAVKQCDFIVVSIFVNPTQFGPGEDFKKYPRPMKADLKICREHGVDIVFNPTPEVMYGAESLTWVDVEKISEPLCGGSRPGHFRGVATVCAKLFNIVGPDVAYFGQKDAQQAVLIKRMIADLDFPIKVVVCQIVRAADGLALSSRNKYLSKQQRKDATCIYKSLQAGRKMITKGTKDPKRVIAEMRKILRTADSLSSIDYISIVDTEMLQDVSRIESRVLVAVAAKFGPTRLIDNMVVDAAKR